MVRPSALAASRLMRNSNVVLINRDVAQIGPVEDLVHVMGHVSPELGGIGGIGQKRN